MKTTKLFQALVATAFLLAITPAWAIEQDTGYPWYGDLPKETHQTVPQSSNIVVAPVVPSGEDTGYPWFADIKEDDESITKPVTIFKSHPRTVEGDSGYPWHADTKDDHPTSTQHKTMVQ